MRIQCIRLTIALTTFKMWWAGKGCGFSSDGPSAASSISSSSSSGSKFWSETSSLTSSNISYNDFCPFSVASTKLPSSLRLKPDLKYYDDIISFGKTFDKFCLSIKVIPSFTSISNNIWMLKLSQNFCFLFQSLGVFAFNRYSFI